MKELFYNARKEGMPRFTIELHHFLWNDGRIHSVIGGPVVLEVKRADNTSHKSTCETYGRCKEVRRAETLSGLHGAP